jgi:beta-lactamase class C
LTTLPTLRNCMAIAVAAACFAPSASQAADDNARLRAIVDQAIRPVIARYDVPGMAVGVTIDGQPYVFNYGLASIENSTPVSDATLFELGSISKTFAATLASYAQVTGKLSLDDHPGKYMAELKGSPIDKATVLHLATYTAGGLPLQFPEDLSDEQVAGYFQNWKPKAAPGGQRNYSNPSIGLLGHVTELALKRSYADAAETTILAPLGMKSTYVQVPQSAMPNYAWGYDDKNKPGRWQPGTLAGAYGGIRSSAADMLRYIQANIDPGKLAPPLRSAVEGTHVGYFKVGVMVQGLGWEQYPYPVSPEQLQAGNSMTMAREANPAHKLSPPQTPSAATLYNKTGATGRFSAFAAFVPEKKIGIVILANKMVPGPDRIEAAHAILRQIAP